MSHLASTAVRFDGQYAWGYIEASPAGRTVWMHRRLTLYPPGITSRERLTLIVQRNWPVVGAVIVLFAMLALSEVLSPVAAMVLLVVVYGGSVVAISHTTRQLRSRVLHIDVDSIAVANGSHSEGDIELFRWARAELLRLDAGHRRGDLTAVDFEAGWARVYDRLEECSQVGA